MREDVRRLMSDYDLDLLMYGILAVAFLLELAFDPRSRLNKASMREAASNLAVTVFHNLGKYIFIPPLVVVYRELFRFRIQDMPWTWWGLVLALVVVDFTYYVHHRSMHRVGLFWTVHAVHHQPRFVNLSMSTRLSFFNKAITYWFYLPLAILGIPIGMLGLVGLINGFYQALTHSRFFLLPKLLRNVLIDSRDHHLHHSRNKNVFDLNFGGMFAVWDRLFGTRPSTEMRREYDSRFSSGQIVYGLPGEIGETKTVENPFVSNLLPFRDLWRDVVTAGPKALVMRPGSLQLGRKEHD